jgi:two-component system cell cycle sensor histidine kinase/response regulator CckA
MYDRDSEIRPGARLVSLHDAPSRPRTILLVEDSSVIRKIMSRLLVNAGFDVLEAGSGPDALQVLDTSAQPIDLLITDLWLPGMNGRQVVAEVRGRQPDVRILYVTGDPSEVIAEPFLAKPFMPGQLLSVVNDILSSRTELRSRERTP